MIAHKRLSEEERRFISHLYMNEGLSVKQIIKRFSDKYGRIISATVIGKYRNYLEKIEGGIYIDMFKSYEKKRRDKKLQDLNFINLVYFNRDELKRIVEGLPTETLSRRDRLRLVKRGLLSSRLRRGTCGEWIIKDGVLVYRRLNRRIWEVTEEAKKILNSILVEE